MRTIRALALFIVGLALGALAHDACKGAPPRRAGAISPRKTVSSLNKKFL